MILGLSWWQNTQGITWVLGLRVAYFRLLLAFGETLDSVTLRGVYGFGTRGKKGLRGLRAGGFFKNLFFKKPKNLCFLRNLCTSV